MSLILDLCGGTGAWSKPYREAGYDVLLIELPFNDVRDYLPPEKVHGILAAPPCTEFAGSGARWWSTKSHWRLHDALSIVDACLKIICVALPKWWALENPVGLLSKYLGPPKMTFQPWEFGNPYTKKTCLWGNFNSPKKNPVKPTEGGKMWKLPPSSDRRKLRSITPSGFAKAFFEANP